jgi:GNAT superfamily N-acetyltransferase
MSNEAHVEDYESPDEDDEEIRTTSWPDPDRPQVQIITVEVLRNDAIVGRLEAIRFAVLAYDPDEDAHHAAVAFDEHSACSAGLGQEVHRRRKAIAARSGWEISCGLLGILDVQVEPEARGAGMSIRLVHHLRRLHAGMTWHVALEAVPLELKEGPDSSFRAMRSRLIRHYARMGFATPSPRASPSLMIAVWDGETGLEDQSY